VRWRGSSVSCKNIYQCKDRYEELVEAGLKIGRGQSKPKPKLPAEEGAEAIIPQNARGELLAARERKIGQQELELEFFK
jgi:hypothetical protein